MNQETRGTVGLNNLGNTCFMNACLQILSHTPEFNKVISDYTNSNMTKPMVTQWTQLHTALWSASAKSVSPTAFHASFQKSIHTKTGFKGFKQQDASEFFALLVDGFHTALAREVSMTVRGTATTTTDKIAVQCYETIKQMYSKDYSEMFPLFFGMYVSEIVSVATKKTLSFKTDPYLELNLSISSTSAVTLKECIDAHCAGETIEGYMNETTKQPETVMRRIKFWSFPKVFVIALKRFSNSNQKNNVAIDFPMLLDMSPYSYHPCTKTYELYGVCQHMGGTAGGHYTACVKHAITKEWYLFNDQQVTHLNSGSVKATISRGAYCLFYQKYPKE